MVRHALRKPLSGEQISALGGASSPILRAREILQSESDALRQLALNVDDTFAQAVELLLNCRGSVVVCGMGKAGLIGQKLSASLSSTGTPSQFLHPAEAVHGDLGRIRAEDVVLVLSYSGETEEVTRILPMLKKWASAVVALTARTSSTLGRLATLTLPLGEYEEAGAHGLAPTTTTTAMLALGDALTLVVSEQRGFTRDQFARFHPAGNLGRQLTGVCEVMRSLDECRIAHQSQTLRNVMVSVSRPGRRTGAIMLTNDSGQLVGIFTDSDLARLLERSEETKLDQSISQVMTRTFTTVSENCLLPEAIRIMSERKISELPVVDGRKIPLGMVDVTDVVTVATAEFVEGRPTEQTVGHENASSLRQVLRVVRE